MKAISNIIETYKTILKIKKQVNDLREVLPSNTLGGAVDHVNSIMASKIDALTEEIIKEENGIKTTTRRSEIKIELKGALEAIAVRLDKGFEFEVRSTPKSPQTPDDNGVVPTIDATETTLKRIAEMQGQLAYVRAEGEPILKLAAKLPEEVAASPKPTSTKGARDPAP